MSDLPVALQTALETDNPTVFGALQIDLNDGRVIRLLDSSGQLVIDGNTFAGKDATFGTLAAVDAIDDGMSDQAPAMSLTLLPASTAAAQDLAAADMQGSRVRLWIGAVTRSTGAVIDKYLLFDGELDVPILTADQSTRELKYECVSSMERLFENNEGARMSDAFHESVWPGEGGMEPATGLVKKIYWGASKPASTSSSTGGGGWSGGFMERGVSLR